MESRNQQIIAGEAKVPFERAFPLALCGTCPEPSRMGSGPDCVKQSQFGPAKPGRDIRRPWTLGRSGPYCAKQTQFAPSFARRAPSETGKSETNSAGGNEGPAGRREAVAPNKANSAVAWTVGTVHPSKQQRTKRVKQSQFSGLLGYSRGPRCQTKPILRRPGNYNSLSKKVLRQEQ